jgi:hypothetical protein
MFRVWRGKKTLSLVSFDVKGAYNNVATEPEIRRLRHRQIPEVIVRRVQDFCTNRQACILVNRSTQNVQEIPQVSVPRGSKLADKPNSKRDAQSWRGTALACHMYDWFHFVGYDRYVFFVCVLHHLKRLGIDKNKTTTRHCFRRFLKPPSFCVTHSQL